MEQNTEVEIKKYLRSGELIKHKLKEYVPAMIITNFILYPSLPELHLI